MRQITATLRLLSLFFQLVPLILECLLTRNPLPLQFHLLLHPLLLQPQTVIFIYQLRSLLCHLHPHPLNLVCQPLIRRLRLHQLPLQLTLALTRLYTQLLIALREFTHLNPLVVDQLVLLAEVVPQVAHLEGHQLHPLLVLPLQPQVLCRPLVELLMQELLSLRPQFVYQFIFNREVTLRLVSDLLQVAG
jgi:hypothetical protein